MGADDFVWRKVWVRCPTCRGSGKCGCKCDCGCKGKGGQHEMKKIWKDR